MISLLGNDRLAAGRSLAIPPLLWPTAAYVALGLFQLWP